MQSKFKEKSKIHFKDEMQAKIKIAKECSSCSKTLDQQGKSANSE